MKSLKALLLSSVLFIALSGLAAQGQDWLWAKGVGGTSNDKANAIASDSSGNTYVAGYFEGTAIFGATTLTGSGGQDIFVAKLDSGGNWLWATKAGGSSSDHAYGISVDNAANVYVTGSFSGTATFGTATLTASGNTYDIFVAKLDSAGSWIWAKKAGGGNGDAAYAIAVDSFGGIYITGSFQWTATFGTTTLTASGNTIDIFVAKLDSSGNWIWANRAGGTGSEFGAGIAVDSAANVYLTGSFSNTASFGTGSLTSSGSSDIFAAKLSSSGTWLWAKGAGGTSNDSGSAIAVDSYHNVYLTGSFGGYNGSDATFGTTTMGSSGVTDIFAAKLDSAGIWIWAKKAGGAGADAGLGIAVDSADNAYLTGYYNYSATFGSCDLSGQAYDIFVAKLDSTGNWLWAKSAGGTNLEDSGAGIALDSAGNVYLTGYFSSTGTFGGSSLTSSGGFDIFVAKLGLSGSIPKAPQNLQIQRSDQSITLTWDAVTEDTNNQPLIPDTYEIYISENNSIWTDLATVSSTD